MESIIITSAKYLVDTQGVNMGIRVTINEQEILVPLDPANTSYAEIMRQVEAGTLVIAEA